MKKTKIVCTIGPKTDSEESLFSLIQAGMDVMRLNFSHGNYEEHRRKIKNLRKALKKTSQNVGILLDTKGPEIRTMKLKGNKDVFLKAGQKFILTTNKNIVGDNKQVAITYPGFIDHLSVGNKILVDDGLISMIVLNIVENNVICRILNDGNLSENKGVNVPGKSVNLPVLAEKDKMDLDFGIEQDVDFVAASFIRNPSDVLEIKEYLRKNGGERIQIFSKIENQEGLNNFDKILQVSDGIMVARGDLGVEIPVEEVIFAQKMIIEKCNRAKKSVITATQMLESMIKNPRPTRAEAGDVANAILDGTDAVMLSGESSTGKYPLEAVTIMATICEKTDQLLNSRINLHKDEQDLCILETICKTVVEISEKLRSPLIVVSTESGQSAKSIRKYFPKAQILAITTNLATVRKLILSKGITCRLVKKNYSTKLFHKMLREIILKSKFAKEGETIIVLSKSVTSEKISSTVSIHKI